MSEKQVRWQKRSFILYRLKSILDLTFESGILTPLEKNKLSTAFSIIREVIRDSVKSSIELGFNAKKRCPICGKPVVEGSEYCKEHIQKKIAND